jgi:PD-(D/E)XK endonuclease
LDNVLTSDQKGNIAETAIVAAAVKLGIDVYRPVGEGGRYDMIFEVEDRLWRVQCKWAARYDDILIVRCYSSRRTVGGKIVNRPYTSEQVDAFAVYSLDVDTCYLLPAGLWAAKRQVHLRLGPTKNNQAHRINWAKEFEFAATLGRRGAVAQLGERLSGRQKATGSSPVGSIDKSPYSGRWETASTLFPSGSWA